MAGEGGPADPVRWGFLSTARINDRVLDGGVRNADSVDVIAVAGRDKGRVEDYARERGIERAYAGYDAMLADPDIEAVYISLPNSMHAEWSVRALEAGKHVLCEKPFSRRAADVERAFEVATRNDRLLMEAFMYRHNPQTAELKRLVDAGTIGTLQAIRCGFRWPVADPGDIRLSAELDGGSLMDLGTYCVNICRYLAGEPEHVYGEQAVDANGVDVRFAGTLVFASGVVAQFDDAVTLPPHAEIEVAGETGSLLVDDPWLCRRPGIQLRRGEDSLERLPIPGAESYGLEFENFSAAIRGAAKPLLGRADALGQARTLEALYQSAADGRTVRLPTG
ncbi:MAG: D-xylose 1-dehydrogenase D-xylono,5-lactone-forming [Solirubrobacteraceae bacterium]|nr:D-xylose 1-dehydrogenase D-xylono,5-lactone-forming [Solirubrobacteraceae bacterium]